MRCIHVYLQVAALPWLERSAVAETIAGHIHKHGFIAMRIGEARPPVRLLSAIVTFGHSLDSLLVVPGAGRKLWRRERDPCAAFELCSYTSKHVHVTRKALLTD